MSRLVGSRTSVVVLLLSILILLIGVSVARGSGSSGGSSQATAASTPTIAVAPIKTVVEDCSGTAEFTVFGSGWEADDLLLITLQTEDRILFVGAGLVNNAGAFSDDITASVNSCAVLSVWATSRARATASTPVAIVATK